MRTLSMLTALVAGLLAGCEAHQGPIPVSETSARYWVKRLVLPDDRTVLCVSYSDGSAGGVSCDWESAR